MGDLIIIFAARGHAITCMYNVIHCTCLFCKFNFRGLTINRENCKIGPLKNFPLPYSWEYWWELNLAVGSQIAIAKILADFNLVVWYGITIYIIMKVRSFDLAL